MDVQTRSIAAKKRLVRQLQTALRPPAEVAQLGAAEVAQSRARALRQATRLLLRLQRGAESALMMRCRGWAQSPIHPQNPKILGFADLRFADQSDLSAISRLRKKLIFN
jgi:hypothetical protein